MTASVVAQIGFQPRVRQKRNLSSDLKLIWVVQSSSENIWFSLNPNQLPLQDVLSRKRGVGHRQERWDGMQWAQ
jgi:hypothetical protein